MILTAIVITMGIAAFILALTYRSYRITTAEDVSNDPEDARVAHLSDDEAMAADEDREPLARVRGSDEPDELDALPPDEPEERTSKPDEPDALLNEGPQQ
jgi:multicomponent Na+:H+ antiporter subunit C